MITWMNHMAKLCGMNKQYSHLNQSTYMANPYIVIIAPILMGTAARQHSHQGSASQQAVGECTLPTARWKGQTAHSG